MKRCVIFKPGLAAVPLATAVNRCLTLGVYRCTVMNKNVKLLAGAAGFGILMGLVLPSRDVTAPPEVAVAEAASEPAAIVNQPAEPAFAMGVTMPTDFTMRGSGADSSAGTAPMVDPKPMSVPNAGPAFTVARDGSGSAARQSAPPAAQPQLNPPPESAPLPSIPARNVGPKLDRTPLQ